MKYSYFIILAICTILSIKHATAQIFQITSTGSADAPVFNINGTPLTVAVGYSLAGSFDINSGSGKLSFTGSLVETGASVSGSFVKSVDKVVFTHNPFPEPGGVFTTNTYTDTMQATVNYGGITRPVTASNVDPVYISGNNYRVPMTFSGSMPIDLTLTLSENGSPVSTQTIHYLLNVSLGVQLDTTDYPSSVEVSTAVVDQPFSISMFEITAPSGNVFGVSVPEPTEYASAAGCLALGIGVWLRSRRLRVA